MTWPAEDGGPRRRQTVPGALGLGDGCRLEATTRVAPATTMVVGGSHRAVFLLRHTPARARSPSSSGSTR